MEGSTKNVNFMTLTPGTGVLVLGRGHKTKSENALFLQKSSSLLPDRDQTNQVCRNDDQGIVYQNLNFMTPGPGVPVLGRYVIYVI